MPTEESDVYEIYAVRYAEHKTRYRWQNFIRDDRPNEPEPMDFYSWVLIGQ